MGRDDERLTDILDVARAMRFVKGRSQADLSSDDLLVAALVQKITVIGEAAARVSDERRAELSHLPWREMIGMRNLVTHDYWQVDPEILWRTVTGDIPALLEQLDAIGLPDG